MTAMTYGGAVRWARPAVAMLVAQVAATLTTERIIACDECGATWLGYPDDPCDWCIRAKERQMATDRDDLLHPTWAQDRGPVYDQLSEVDKAVWNRTRNITYDHDSIAFWVQRIGRAVDSGLITQTDADLAITRVERWLEGV